MNNNEIEGVVNKIEEMYGIYEKHYNRHKVIELINILLNGSKPDVQKLEMEKLFTMAKLM